jgi:hypothetical protein
VGAWSKACVCGRSLAGIAGSNPAGGMDVCLLFSVVRYRPVRRAEPSSRAVLPSVCVCVCVRACVRACVMVIACNSNPLSLQSVGRKEAKTRKERNMPHDVT